MIKKLFSALILLTIFSCKGSETNEKDNTFYNFSSMSGVYVTNEGNYNAGNSTLSFYNNVSGQIYNEVFINANKAPLGDVAQAMTIRDNKGYIVTNGSGKMNIININTGEHINIIRELGTPKFIYFVNDTKAYITDINSKYITIFNPKTDKVAGKIEIVEENEFPSLSKGQDQVVAHGGFIYTCCWAKDNELLKIDPSTDKIVERLNVGKVGNSLTVDKNGNIWVLADGGWEDNVTKGSLTKVNTTSFTIEKELFFDDLGCYPNAITVDKSAENLIFIIGAGDTMVGGVYKMSISATELPTQPFIGAGAKSFYSLSVDRRNGDIYVGDAGSYDQPGYVYRYDMNGVELDNFKVGVVPGYICIK